MAGQRGTRAPGLLRCARQLRRGTRLPHPGDTALVPGASPPQPENPAHLAPDEPHRDPLATPNPHHAPIPGGALRRHTPKVGAQCGNPARWDLCGGPPARAVPTATLTRTPNAGNCCALLSNAMAGRRSTFWSRGRPYISTDLKAGGPSPPEREACRCREIRFISGTGARQTPVVKPARSYVICCVQRTGSWLLSHTLADTGYAGRPSDYFDEAERENRTREWGLPPGRLAQYVRAMWDHATTPNGVLGSKLMWNDFDWIRFQLRPPAGTDAGLAFMRTTFPNAQFVWLRRQDKVRQGISW